MIRLIAVICILLSCSGTKFIKSIEKKLAFNVIQESFIGLSVYDLDEDKFIYRLNDEKKFTPASNAKLLTFLSSLEYLPKNLRSIRYRQTNDSLIIWGTGDPSFLHYRFAKNDSLIQFLKRDSANVYLSRSNDETSRYASGWAWDDYNDYYQAENTSLPIYGNVLTAIKDSLDTLKFYPKTFLVAEDTFLNTKSLMVKRDLNKNIFSFRLKGDTVHKTVETPFIYSDSLLINFFRDSLNKEVKLSNYNNIENSKFLISTERDSLLKEMMAISDNFLAEQLLYMISDQLFDTLSRGRTIGYLKDSLFSKISEQRIKWVDGSGLSRYNLMSPRFFVDLLVYLHNKYPFDLYRDLFARNGKRGTLEKRFNAPNLYLYGKTGTLSNNHNLLGYLETKSGKTICFSFMMNHYLSSTRQMISIMDHIIMDLYHYY
jgi:serine-type D-Ala-D-Ala carboxypeptidase/endopeptidase (penicillin-binding protein 4)